MTMTTTCGNRRRTSRRNSAGLMPGMLMSASSSSNLAGFELRQRVVGRVGGAHLVPLAAEELGERLEDDPVLVEDQQAGLVGGVGLEHFVSWRPLKCGEAASGMCK